jgi:large subunit ribosomal protein L17
MRHLKFGNKLSRTASHRHAMLGNLAMSVLDKERVITTVAKAKAVRSVVERLITHARGGGIHLMRVAGRIVTDKTILKKLFDDIGPSYKDRVGGYTRILKLGERPGDNASMCILELTGRNSQELAIARKKKKKKTGEPTAATAAQAPSAEKAEQEKKEEKEKKPKEKAPKKPKVAKEASKDAAKEEPTGAAGEDKKAKAAKKKKKSDKDGE